MKMHSRDMTVAKAHNELAEAVTLTIEKHKLTYGELFQILSLIMGSWAKWSIRDERGSKVS